MEPLTPATPAELQFTPEDRVEFDATDRHVGKAVGLLLGGFFFISVVLMIGVNWWTLEYRPTTLDPQADVGAKVK